MRSCFQEPRLAPPAAPREMVVPCDLAHKSLARSIDIIEAAFLEGIFRTSDVVEAFRIQHQRFGLVALEAEVMARLPSVEVARERFARHQFHRPQLALAPLDPKDLQVRDGRREFDANQALADTAREQCLRSVDALAMMIVRHWSRCRQ